MIRNKNVHDRLYLSRDEDIYIDNCKIPQHHIEGIRFLYRQFKRHKKGVIINDPFSFGRNIQIILFLKAICPLLKKQVLILCQEEGEQNWIERFHTWTDLYDDVVIQSTNPTFKKQIIINAMVNLPVFCDREWSIVIVDGEDNTPTDLILKLPFKANFKIWNTSLNMKKNLNKFAEIYKWLFPNESFDKEYFIPNPNSAVDVIEKSILLESFMEDIVIRRDDLDSSFEKYHRDVMPPPKTTTTATNTALTITRKNKDAGGTKIKRSKTKVTDTADESKPDEPLTAALSSFLGETSKPCEIFDSTDDFSIDNYKKKITDISVKANEKNEHPFKIIEIGNSEEHDLKLYQADSLSGTRLSELEEMDTLVFGHDLFIKKVPEGNEKEFACDKDRAETAKVVVTTSKLNIEDINNSQPDTTTKKSGKNETEIDDDNKIVSNINTIDTITDSDAADDRLKERRKDDVFTKNKDQLNKEIGIMGTNDDSENVTKRNSHNNNKVDEEKIKSTDEIQIKTNEINKKTEDTEQNILKRNIDDRIKEYEEKVSKKLKGSLLDSLF